MSGPINYLPNAESPYIGESSGTSQRGSGTEDLPTYQERCPCTKEEKGWRRDDAARGAMRTAGINPHIQDKVLDAGKGEVMSDGDLQTRMRMVGIDQPTINHTIHSYTGMVAKSVEKKERWITLTTEDEEGEKHGTTHVRIDDAGKVTAGPSHLEGHPVNNLPGSSGGKPFGGKPGKKPKKKPKPPKSELPKPEEEEKPAVPDMDLQTVHPIGEGGDVKPVENKPVDEEEEVPEEKPEEKPVDEEEEVPEPAETPGKVDEVAEASPEDMKQRGEARSSSLQENLQGKLPKDSKMAQDALEAVKQDSLSEAMAYMRNRHHEAFTGHGKPTETPEQEENLRQARVIGRAIVNTFDNEANTKPEGGADAGPTAGPGPEPGPEPKPGSGGEGSPADAGGTPTASQQVEGETGGPSVPDAGGQGTDQAEPASAEPTQHPSTRKVVQRINRYAKVFQAKGMEAQAGWMRDLKDQINELGADEALEELGEEKHGFEGRVQYEGAYDEPGDTQADTDFIHKYLDQSGITLLHSDSVADPNQRYVSSWSAQNLLEQGRDRVGYDQGENYLPTDQTFAHKLEEAQHLPGLESSEDIHKVNGGEKVTHFTPDLVAKMDEKYGKGQWIVKSYGEEAYAGFGIFFPQRVKQIQRDAKASMLEAKRGLRDRGFNIAMEDDKVVGVKQGKQVYKFGTPEFDQTMGKNVKRLVKQAVQASHSVNGARLPMSPEDALINNYGMTFVRNEKGEPTGITDRNGKEYAFDDPKIHKIEDMEGGSVGHEIHRAVEADGWRRQGYSTEPKFMVQPAFKAVGVSDYDRAMGATWETAKEGRVHCVTRNGKASAVPYATLVGRGDDLPAVFASEDSKAMEKAVEDAINQLPESERAGQMYAPDVMKTKDGWKVIELNPSAAGGGSDWLGRNPFVIDAVVSHMTGREPQHVKFIRNLLMGRKNKLMTSPGKPTTTPPTGGKMSRFDIKRIVKSYAGHLRDQVWREYYGVRKAGGARGKPCEQGQSAMRTGCVPAHQGQAQPRQTTGHFATPGKGRGEVYTATYGSMKSKYSLHSNARINGPSIPLKNYKQQDDHSCGFVAALTLARYLVPHTTAQDVMRVVQPTKSAGISGKYLIKALNKLDIKVKYKGDLKISDLRKYVEKGTPVLITVYPEDWSSDHWTIVQGFDENKVYLTNHRSMTIKEFKQQWYDKGEGLVCSKMPEGGQESQDVGYPPDVGIVPDQPQTTPPGPVNALPGKKGIGGVERSKAIPPSHGARSTPNHIRKSGDWVQMKASDLKVGMTVRSLLGKGKIVKLEHRTNGQGNATIAIHIASLAKPYVVFATSMVEVKWEMRGPEEIDEPPDLPEHYYHRCKFLKTGVVKYYKDHQPTIAVDFDGTICEYNPTYNLATTNLREGSREQLRRLHEAGVKVIVWTSRDDLQAVGAWLDQEGVPYDYLNENPDTENGSRKIQADLYIDDHGVAADRKDWEDLADEILARLLGKATQPSSEWDDLQKMMPQARAELEKLLSCLNLPSIDIAFGLPLGELEAKLRQPGGIIIYGPNKSRDRAKEKAGADYEGDMSKVLDPVRASVAVDSMDELRAATQSVRGAGGQLVRFPKDRFQEPLSSGYRDVLANYRMPCGMVVEVQYHLKPMLIARERERGYYDTARLIKATMEDEGRGEMTPSEAEAVRRAKRESRHLYARAWDEIQGAQPQMKSIRKVGPISYVNAYPQRTSTSFGRIGATDPGEQEKAGKKKPDPEIAKLIEQGVYQLRGAIDELAVGTKNGTKIHRLLLAAIDQMISIPQTIAGAKKAISIANKVVSDSMANKGDFHLPPIDPEIEDVRASIRALERVIGTRSYGIDWRPPEVTGEDYYARSKTSLPARHEYKGNQTVTDVAPENSLPIDTAGTPREGLMDFTTGKLFDQDGRPEEVEHADPHTVQGRPTGWQGASMKMSSHVWNRRLTDYATNNWFQAYQYALDHGLSNEPAQIFAGYYIETVTQAGGGHGHGLGDQYAMTLANVFAAATRSGHRYAQGRNAGNYRALAHRMLATVNTEQSQSGGMSADEWNKIIDRTAAKFGLRVENRTTGTRPSVTFRLPTDQIPIGVIADFLRDQDVEVTNSHSFGTGNTRGYFFSVSKSFGQYHKDFKIGHGCIWAGPMGDMQAVFLGYVGNAGVLIKILKTGGERTVPAYQVREKRILKSMLPVGKAKKPNLKVDDLRRKLVRFHNDVHTLIADLASMIPYSNIDQLRSYTARVSQLTVMLERWTSKIVMGNIKDVLVRIHDTLSKINEVYHIPVTVSAKETKRSLDAAMDALIAVGPYQGQSETDTRPGELTPEDYYSRSITKAEGEGSCKPGQTAANTGCTPAGGGGGKKPSRKTDDATATGGQTPPVSMATAAIQHAAGFIRGIMAGKKRPSREAVRSAIENLAKLAPSDLINLMGHLGLSTDHMQQAMARQIVATLLPHRKRRERTEEAAPEAQEAPLGILDRPAEERHNAIRDLQNINGKSLMHMLMMSSGHGQIEPGQWMHIIHAYARTGANHSAIETAVANFNREYGRLGAALTPIELADMINQGKLTKPTHSSPGQPLHAGGYLKHTKGGMSNLSKANYGKIEKDDASPVLLAALQILVEPGVGEGEKRGALQRLSQMLAPKTLESKLP